MIEYLWCLDVYVTIETVRIDRPRIMVTSHGKVIEAIVAKMFKPVIDWQQIKKFVMHVLQFEMFFAYLQIFRIGKNKINNNFKSV